MASLLIVDSNPELAQLLMKQAKSSGWTDITLAESVPEAKDMMRDNIPEVVVAGPSALEITPWIRDNFPAIRTLGLPSSAQNIRKPLDEGGNDIIRLPDDFAASTFFARLVEERLDTWKAAIDPSPSHVKRHLGQLVAKIGEIASEYPNTLTIADKEQALRSIADALGVKAAIKVSGAVSDRTKA